MPRKRKVAVNLKKVDRKLSEYRKQIIEVLCKVQINEAYHQKYTKDLQQLYAKMEHDDFASTFILCLKQLMQCDSNQFNNTGLKFMAQFVSSFQDEDMHPLFDTVFLWIVKTVSLTVSIRLRLCEFVNMLLNALPDNGDIEEFQCNEIISYMFDRLKDISPHVRVEAIKALCRLQVKDDPTDEVTQIFVFHLGYDPCPLVRQAVISSIARSEYTIPFIIERLWDVDVRVRRSVLAHMSNFSFNKCTVEQRLQLIEQGLDDSSDTVRKIAQKILLPQWLACCSNNYITFLSGLILDRCDPEMSRFQSVARMSLLALFRLHAPHDLINVLPLIETNDNGNNNNYNRCIQLEKLTPELIVFWATLIEFFQSDDSKGEHLDRILPDVTTFCNYVADFSRQMKSHQMYSTHLQQSILLNLVDMLKKLDFCDEIGRRNVKNIVLCLIVESTCDENVIKTLIQICERLMSTLQDRLQFYVDIVHSILQPFDLKTLDSNSKIEVASLTTKLFELKENETIRLEIDGNDELTAIQNEISLLKEQLLLLTSPFSTNETAVWKLERITSENLLRAIKLIFYGVCSKTVTRLTSSMYHLFHDVIRDRVKSEDMAIRNWSLKCMATFSLLYRKLANDTFHVFCNELHCHENKDIWVTCIAAIFQLICRYGMDFSTVQHTDNERMLLLFSQHLDSIDDVDIKCELVDGFCMLILHGRLFDKRIMSKLIVMYFNADVDTKIIQILSIFFETVIREKKQKFLLLSLAETLTAIVNDKTLPNENTLRSVVKFFVQSTTNEKEETESNEETEIYHNDLADTLLTWMDHNSTDKKSLNVISKEILLLTLSDHKELRLNLRDLVDHLVEQSVHKETEKNLKLFNQMLMQQKGNDTLEFSSTRPADGVENDEMSVSNEDSDAELQPENNGKNISDSHSENESEQPQETQESKKKRTRASTRHLTKL